MQPLLPLTMASWKAPCNADQDKGQEVLARSLDQKAGDVRTVLSRNRFDLPMAMRFDAVGEAFGDIRGTPTVFVVDRAGILRFKHLGGIPPEDLERIVEKLLNRAS